MAGETVIFYAWPNQNAYFKNAYAVDANNNTLPCEYDSQTQQGQLTMPDCDIRIIVEFSKQPDFPDPVNPVYSVEEINQAIEDEKTVISVDGNVTIGKGQSVVIPEGVELVIYRTTLKVDGGTLTVNGEISAVGLTIPMASISGNHYEAGLTIANYSSSFGEDRSTFDGTGELNGAFSTTDPALISPGSAFSFYWDGDHFRPRLSIDSFEELETAVQLDAAKLSVDGEIVIAEDFVLPDRLEMEIYGDQGSVTVQEGATLTLGESSKLFAIFGHNGDSSSAGSLLIDGTLVGADNTHIYCDNTDLYQLDGTVNGNVTGLPQGEGFETWYWVWHNGEWVPAGVNALTAEGLAKALTLETMDTIDVPEGRVIDFSGYSLTADDVANPGLYLRVLGRVSGADSLGVYDTDIDIEYANYSNKAISHTNAHILTAEQYAQALEMDFDSITMDRKSGPDYNRNLEVPEIRVDEGKSLYLCGTVTVTKKLTVYGELSRSGTATLVIGPDAVIDAAAPFDALQPGKAYTYSGGAWVETNVEP